MADKRLLTVKAALKRKQPRFLRQQAHARKKLKEGWRKPRGLHSKMKDGIKGHPKALAMGYRTPRAVRGMTKHGLYPARVERPEDLSGLDPKRHAVVLGKVGARKQIAIIEQAAKAGFTLLNASQEKAAKLREAHAKKPKREKKVPAPAKEAPAEEAPKAGKPADVIAEEGPVGQIEAEVTPKEKPAEHKAPARKAEAPVKSEKPKRKTPAKKGAKKE